MCNAIKKCQKRVESEEEKPRNQQEFLLTPNRFETSVGHFWGILETLTYMRARCALVEALSKIDTLDAVRSALSHLMDMLRLCRSDNMGVRDIISSLMLRLGKEQECYDFVL